MQAADPCVECGGTELKLLDGYYYCVECNTQNTNARETVIEQKTVGDGTFAIGTRRKITKIHDSKIQMSAEWYKWHAYNFIISGLADELVDAGAKPTFKLKLLWIWTRYVKTYQNKDALGMAKNTDVQNNDNLTLPSFMVEENSSSNPVPDEQEHNEIENEDIRKNIKKNVIMEGSKRDIKFLSKGVIIAMLYLALNLDESDIQLYQLLRFIKEKRVNLSNIQRFVPKEIDLKSKQVEWLKFISSKVCCMHRTRALAMTLLRKLDLGTPKVPNMRKIIDDFVLELCLPNDVKPLIYSLMFFHHCDFLDISSKSKEHLIHTPDYEGVAMSYVLVAMKMCFGLDGDYEEKLSDAVDKINDERNLTKSYRVGNYSDPSTRLFSFREWCSYLQFRKITLCKSSLHMAEQHFLEIDDNVYIEHMNERPQHNKELQDETAMNLLSKIPDDEEGRVIPKHLFQPTLTPMTDYTEIIIEHTQDHEIKGLLSEDFTQYSLSYACEHLQLVDSSSENIIKGVSEDRKIVSKDILGTIIMKKSKKAMVYVKNCENRNWMITNPPKMEHVTCEDALNTSNDKQSDHGYDSEHPVNEKEVCRENENVDENDQRMTKDSSRGNDSELANENDITENIDITNRSINENNMILWYSESLVNEKSKETVNGLEKVAHEKVSEEAENKNDSEESMHADSKVLRYPENLVNESEVLKESEILSKTVVNGFVNQTNEGNVSEVADNINDSDDSMEEDSRGIHDPENLVNDKEVSDKPENDEPGIDQNMRDTENSANEKEVSEQNESIVQITDQGNKEDKIGYIITEEDDGKNIFDDLFIELELKEEMEQNNEEDYYGDNEEPIPNNNSVFDDRASMSDVTDDDGVFATFNPDTFDRERTIKELILNACKKYKIPIPKEYKTAKEPRKRKLNAFGDEETPREPRKRAKVNKFEAKSKVEELVSGYYSLKETDLLNQMQEAVSLAIRSNQFDSLLNVTQNETANIQQASDALTRASSFLTSNVENQSIVTMQNQTNVNPQTSLREQTDKEQNPDKTDDDEQIDEHWEAKLFEGEEETKLDDLVPKGDPKFDEEKYDVNQLYIKIKMDEKEDDGYNFEDVPSKIEEIVNQKIEQCKNSAEFANLKPANRVKSKFESDDSEDELPLNVLQEEKRLLEEKISWEDNFEPLINKDNVSEFKYWFRHYDEDFMTRSADWHTKFDEELKENTPSSFYFVIRECAAILNSSTFSLYKHMQNLEKYISARAKYPDK